MKRLLPFPALVFLVLPGASAQMFLSGQVAMADGEQLPARIAIQRVCSGVARTAAYTDRKGQFSFQWDQLDDLAPNVSDPIPGGGPRGSTGTGVDQANAGFGRGVAMIGCTLRADAAGYRSESIPLDGRRSLSHSDDVGTIVLHRLEGQSASATSHAASQNVPPDARKAFDKGLDALQRGKTADAEKNFEKAVSLYSQYADAWLDLGKLRLQRNDKESAGEAFQKALDADDKLVEAHVELGMLASQQKQWAEVAKHLDIALQLDPVNFPEAWFTDAVAGYNLKNYDAAEKSLRVAMKLDSQHKNPQANYLLGLIFASKKNYSGAAEQLRLYLKLAPGADDVAKVREQLAEIEKLQAQIQP
jgi:tetratricopeptide (TPR) repeat protein